MAFVAVTLESQGLSEAITGLDRLDASLRDMQNLSNDFDILLADALVRLVEVTPVGEGDERPHPRMRDSWDAEGGPQGNYEWAGRIFNTAPHAKFVLQGTGVFGPTGRPIVAQPGNPFRFVYQGRRFVLREHQGQPPNDELNFLLDEELPDQTLRAAGRALRGEVLAHFQKAFKAGVA